MSTGWRHLADAVMGNVAAPVGAVVVEEWGDALTPQAFRLFYGPTHTVELEHGQTVEVITRGAQSANGGIEESGILVYGGSDDAMPPDAARKLAAALIAAADEVDRFAGTESA
ncbi:hypothetical protein [Mycobacterium branderi]|uniref:Uncharacterized protein n=1 Tax=Mycobacterium branderi TaxID=43348 RepID=A0A7I7W3C7_9MYCO|nr:hypothetical protein [Mycobacterium branderi]MCV7234783.1 hypothetical protein [Mycobacterium branderi]ORA33621.1 hypothetical protein BST20_22415 [Mycobacterium branderi]BBZ11590.1 hypothetical protein MBRA_17850 [Mycobacterium branderi]